jgi:hypothetical protein
MLYLIDSTAKNSLGHNLEYLERISSFSKSDYLILGNKELNPNEDLRYRPTFEFGTWDFGRFGVMRKKSKESGARRTQTLRSSKALLVTEKLVEILASFTARFTSALVLTTVGFSKQSSCFRRDIGISLPAIGIGSTMLISTANARELVGLHQWLSQSVPKSHSITIILRRPILDLRSFLEIPFLFFEALTYLVAIQRLTNRVQFFADTPGLAARISLRSKRTIENIAALGYELDLESPKGPLDFAMAPNSRLETRYVAEGLISIPDLSSQESKNLDSNSYKKLLTRTKTLVLPYDPLRYRSRSSGIFAEALTLGILPIVPTGTSMSREIAKLNNGVLTSAEFHAELMEGGEIDLSQFGLKNFIVTFKANFCSSLILEISDNVSGTRRSTHDFFEPDSMDSFLIHPTKETVITFKSDKILFNPGNKLDIYVYKTENQLFGLPYLEGDLLKTLSILESVSFCNRGEINIGGHSPHSICQSLGI